MNNSDNGDKGPSTIYAVLSCDEIDGEHGIVALGNEDGVVMPMVFSDHEKIERAKIVMQEVVKGTGKHIKLFKFTNSQLIFEATDKSTH